MISFADFLPIERQIRPAAGSAAKTKAKWSNVMKLLVSGLYFTKSFTPVGELYRAQVFAAHKITVSGASHGFVSEQIIEKWMKYVVR